MYVCIYIYTNIYLFINLYQCKLQPSKCNISEELLRWNEPTLVF